MSRRSKIIANILMLGMVTISTTCFITLFEMKIVTVLLGIIGSIVILFFVKTVED